MAVPAPKKPPIIKAQAAGSGTPPTAAVLLTV
jgi:hypothetical protein